MEFVAGVRGGAEPAPEWLQTGVIAAGCGGRTRAERRVALREYTQAPVRQGRIQSPWGALVGGVVLGGKEFAQALLRGLKSGSADPAMQTAVRQIARTGWITWPEIAVMAEAVRGRCWAEMAEAWGDWGRDGTICVMVRHGQQRLTGGGGGRWRA